MTIMDPVPRSELGSARPLAPSPRRAPARPDPSLLAASLEESAHGFALVATAHDGRDRFLWANPSFLAIVRRAEADVVGAPLDDVLPGAMAGGDDAAGWFAGPGYAPALVHPSGVRCPLADGRSVVTHVRHLRDERRRPLFALVELETPAPDDGQGTAEPAAGPAELERTNHELAHVTSVIAHDLRQPLAVITGFAEHLRRRPAVAGDAELEALAADIVQGCNEITTILDNAMAYVQASPEPGTLTLVGAGGAVQAAWWNVQALAEARGGRIDVRPLPLLAFDPVQLRQVFQNLLANALTYVAPGVAPSIVVSASRRGGRWIIAVEDNGVGMPAGRRAGDEGPRRPAADGVAHGSGLGLLISRRIVRRHGGRLWSEPAPGGGTIVRFDVPDPVGEGN